MPVARPPAERRDARVAVGVLPADGRERVLLLAPAVLHMLGMLLLLLLSVRGELVLGLTLTLLGGRGAALEGGRGEGPALVGELLWAGTRVRAFEETTLVAEDFARGEVAPPPGARVGGAAVEAPPPHAIAELRRRVVRVHDRDRRLARRGVRRLRVPITPGVRVVVAHLPLLLHARKVGRQAARGVVRRRVVLVVGVVARVERGRGRVRVRLRVGVASVLGRGV